MNYKIFVTCKTCKNNTIVSKNGTFNKVRTIRICVYFEGKII